MKTKHCERPFRFDPKVAPEMVRAILGVGKTQTRMPVMPQPLVEEVTLEHIEGTDRFIPMIHMDAHVPKPAPKMQPYWVSPFGQPGDLLWIQEGFMPVGKHPDPGSSAAASGMFYRADSFDHEHKDLSDESGEKWRPSVHMPRWASRITLRVQRVWVHRLQEMDEVDCAREGMEPPRCEKCGYTKYDAIFRGDHHLCSKLEPPSEIDAFRDCWNSIYAKKGLGWEVNPWIWACKFERIST